MNVLGCSWHLVDLEAAEHHTMHFQYLAWKAIVPKFRNVPDNGSQLLGMILRQGGSHSSEQTLQSKHGPGDSLGGPWQGHGEQRGLVPC